MLIMLSLLPSTAYLQAASTSRMASRPPCDLFMSASTGNQPKKPTRRQFKASSHSKTRNQWREMKMHDAPVVRVEGAPTLQTASLPEERASATGVPVGRYPALVLNADYSPLSHVPLSLWSWQDSVRAILRDAVVVISEYDGVSVRSPSVEIALPSVIVLKQYVPQNRRGRASPIFTRRNLFLRDKFCCQYCRRKLMPSQLTYDHVIPRARNGPTTWENVVTACSKCNIRKGSTPLKDLPADMLRGPIDPREPTWPELQRNARLFPPKLMHDDWMIYLGGHEAAASASEAEAAAGGATGGVAKPPLPPAEDWGI